MQKIIAAVAIMAVTGPTAMAQPAVFNPAIQKECILSWFDLTEDDTTDELTAAYNATEPMRLAAVINICSARAGSTSPRCDEICAVEIQVNVEMHRRTGNAIPLKEVERLR